MIKEIKKRFIQNLKMLESLKIKKTQNNLSIWFPATKANRGYE